MAPKALLNLTVLFSDVLIIVALYLNHIAGYFTINHCFTLLIAEDFWGYTINVDAQYYHNNRHGLKVCDSKSNILHIDTLVIIHPISCDMPV